MKSNAILRRPGTRRDFLKRSMALAGAAALPSILPARALGKDPLVPAPSQRITLGAIGIGGMGRMDLAGLLHQPDVQVLAACNVKEGNLRYAVGMVNGQYGNQDCASHRDWRELMARTDLDAIYCATPDHWHAHLHRRCSGGQGHLLPEADERDHRRRPGSGRRRPAPRHRLPERHAAAQPAQLPLLCRDCALGTDRKTAPRGEPHGRIARADFAARRRPAARYRL